MSYRGGDRRVVHRSHKERIKHLDISRAPSRHSTIARCKTRAKEDWDTLLRRTPGWVPVCVDKPSLSKVPVFYPNLARV